MIFSTSISLIFNGKCINIPYIDPMEWGTSYLEDVRKIGSKVSKWR